MFAQRREIPGTVRDQSLPARCKLTDASAFQRVFGNASGRSSDACFTLLFVANGLRYPRFGLAISKKKVPSAVARNRLKRVVRESFRMHLQRLPACDIVVLNNVAANQKTNNELFTALSHHWKNVSARCKSS